MTIYPAIDIFDGKVVRLKRGDYEQMTVYSDNPVAVAEGFMSAGAKALHVVDLEGAKAGQPRNLDIIEKIAAGTGLFVQVGGGVRDLETIDKYICAGVSRVILGTAVMADSGFLRVCIDRFGEAVAVSADIKGGLVAVKGWTEVSDTDVLTFCAAVERAGVRTIICTDISKDGMQSGTNLDLYRMLRHELARREPAVDIIASGGVSAIDEIMTLADIGVSGVILGKALYEGGIDLKEVLNSLP